MGIINIFQKQRQKETKEEKSLLVPKEEEKTTEGPINKSPSQPRDKHGRFSSHQKVTAKEQRTEEVVETQGIKEEKITVKKEEATTKTEEKDYPKEEKKGVVKGPITVKFFGKQVDKYYLNGIWYFSIDNIIGCATPSDPPEVKKSTNFEKVVKTVAKDINGIPCSDSEGLITVIREVIDPFPGPIDRWLRDSAKMPLPEESHQSLPN